jgi:Lrp/AsnC family leucine-responsive transcriptional regulator
MAKARLDEFDLKILSILQREGRLTNVELAERIGLSPTPCLRRVRRLESDGIIEGYSARISRPTVGLGVTVFVEAKLERQQETEAKQFRDVIRRLPEVVSCHIISGRSDFLFEVVLADLNQFSDFVLKKLLSIPGVKDLHSSFALESVKPVSPLPLHLVSASKTADE